LDSVGKEQEIVKDNLMESLNSQLLVNENLERLLASQSKQNEAQKIIISNLELLVAELGSTLVGIQNVQNDTKNATASCKAIVHEFSLADPFDWYLLYILTF